MTQSASDVGNNGGAGRASGWGRLWQQGNAVATALGTGLRRTGLVTLGATDVLARQVVAPALRLVRAQGSRLTSALMRARPGGPPP